MLVDESAPTDFVGKQLVKRGSVQVCTLLCQDKFADDL